MNGNISVICVSLNAGETIKKTIQSFLEQDFVFKELIIIDGGSTDNTESVVNEFLPNANIKYFSQIDNGIYGAMNRGLSIATGDIIGFLNANDVFTRKDFLSSIFDNIRNMDVIFSGVIFSDWNGRKVRTWLAETPPKHLMKYGWMPAHPTLYAKRHVYDAVGPFNEAYKIVADYEWMLRMFHLHEFKFKVVNSIDINMLIGGRSNSNIFSIIRCNWECLRARRSILNHNIIDVAFILKPMRKISQFFAK